jgi:predicted nucleic acid-binding protein
MDAFTILVDSETLTYGAPMLTIFAKRTMALSFATDTELSFAKQKKAKFSFAKTCHILICKNMSYSHSQKHVIFSFAKTCHILIRKNMSYSRSQKHVIFSFAKTCHILIRKNMSYSHSQEHVIFSFRHSQKMSHIFVA